MKRMTRFVAVLLGLTMLLSCMPQAIAEEVVVLEEPIVEEVPVAVEEVIDEEELKPVQREEEKDNIIPDGTLYKAKPMGERNEDAAKTEGCTHPESAVVFEGEYIIQEYAVDIGDPSVHRGYGELVRSYVCSICGEWVRDEVVDPNFEARVYHTFVDNVCKWCGYVLTCSHPEEAVEVEDWRDVISATPIDANKCYVTYNLVEYHWCGVCGYQLERIVREYNVQKTFRHSFIDNVCEWCGFEMTCTHPQEAIILLDDDLFLVDHGVTVDETHCIVYGDHGIRYACTICGYYIDEITEEDTEKTTEHEFENGVCRWCGYVRNLGPLAMSELKYEVAEGKHFFIDKPEISGGTGSYTVAYNIYDDQGNAVNYFYQPEDSNPRVAASPMRNGKFNVFVVVRDGFAEVQKDIGWHVLSGY